MDAPRAREQLRRRYLFLPDTEAPLDREGYARPEASTAVEKKEKPLPRLNIHSGFWILASIVVTYYVDFFKTIKENFHTSSWFVVGGALLLISLSIACYCILYLEWCCGIEDYDVKYPTLIPITTATFIAAGICFNVALWHVWSFPHTVAVVHAVHGGCDAHLTPWMISKGLDLQAAGSITDLMETLQCVFLSRK